MHVDLEISAISHASRLSWHTKLERSIGSAPEMDEAPDPKTRGLSHVHLVESYSKEGALTSILERGLASIAKEPIHRPPRRAGRRLKDKLAESDHAAIVRAHTAEGVSKRQLALRFGVSDYSIRMILLKAGTDSGRPSLPAEQMVEVQSALANGQGAQRRPRGPSRRSGAAYPTHPTSPRSVEAALMPDGPSGGLSGENAQVACTVLGACREVSYATRVR